jgi:multidrug resistance efflux pump
LEWDRVNGRAVVSEVITNVFVERGTFVEQGTPLLQLDDRKTLAEIEALKAQLGSSRSVRLVRDTRQ